MPYDMVIFDECVFGEMAIGLKPLQLGALSGLTFPKAQAPIPQK